MIDNYKILTLTFSDARLEELKDYLIPSEEQVSESQQLSALKDAMAVDELFYLQTCNRVLYLFYSSKPISELHEDLVQFIQKKSDRNTNQLRLNTYSGEDAIRHFFEVGASLKSMVIGEQEILRQVREAYEQSRAIGLSGDQIRILFQSALHAAKTVHHKTRISEKTVSVVSLAMKKLRRLGIHSEDEVVLIGAGETIRKVALFLREWGMKKVRVFNRSENNLHLIKEVLPSAELYFLDQLVEQNINVPYIISCTGHDDYVLTPELIEQSKSTEGLTNTRGILDLAIPRDVHPGILTAYDLKVIEVESLRTVAEKNKAFRIKEVVTAQELINAEVDAFREKIHRRFIEKAFRDIPSEIYAVRDKALHEVYKDQIEHLDPEAKSLVTEMMDYMARKCVSIPMKTARKQYTVIRQEMRKGDRRGQRIQ